MWLSGQLQSFHPRFVKNNVVTERDVLRSLTLKTKRLIFAAIVISYRELLEINHIRTIYHIFVAILIIFTLNTLVYDIVDQGR